MLWREWYDRAGRIKRVSTEEYRQQRRNEERLNRMRDNAELRERQRLRKGRWNEPMKIKRWKGCCLSAMTKGRLKVCVRVCACTHMYAFVREGARLKGWQNCHKIVILLHLQVNGKYLSVITQHGICVCVCEWVCVSVSELWNNGKCMSVMALH